VSDAITRIDFSRRLPNSRHVFASGPASRGLASRARASSTTARAPCRRASALCGASAVASRHLACCGDSGSTWNGLARLRPRVVTAQMIRPCFLCCVRRPAATSASNCGRSVFVVQPVCRPTHARSRMPRRQGLREGSLFERGYQLGHTQILAARDEIDRLSLMQRRDGLSQPNRYVGGVHDTRQTLDKRRELDQPLGPLASGRARVGKPRSCRAASHASRTSDVGVAQLGDIMEVDRLPDKGAGR
jgi:hypothetical protein